MKREALETEKVTDDVSGQFGYARLVRFIHNAVESHHGGFLAYLRAPVRHT